MPILRHGDRRRYTVIDNDTIEDGHLTFKALGLLAYLLSKPDGWHVSSRQLGTVHADGRHAVLAALTELESLGYLTRGSENDPRTGHRVTVTTVHERPVPDHANTTGSGDRGAVPDQLELGEVGAVSGHRGAVNRGRITRGRKTAPVVSTDRAKTESATDRGGDQGPGAGPDTEAQQAEMTPRELEKARGVGKDYRFEDFWESYPARKGYKIGKAKAREQWMKLTYARKQRAFQGARVMAQADDMPPDAERWLRDRKYEDWVATPSTSTRRSGMNAAEREAAADLERRLAAERSK